MPQPDLNNQPSPDDLKKGLEDDLLAKPDPTKEGADAGQDDGAGDDGKTKVPFSHDPQVQLYIERQVAKRVGEGEKAWQERLDRLEQSLTKPKEQTQKTKIGDWEPASESDARAARAIIAQAKKELFDDITQQEQRLTAQQEADDKALGDWLGDLKVAGTIKTDDDQKDFLKMIVDYGLEDKDKAVALWNRLQETKQSAKAEGEVDGIKKAQEAKMGSGRKGDEPGARKRSYAERRAQEPSFDAIRDREIARLQNNN